MWERILRLQREMMELRTIVTILQARIAAMEQQAASLWYQ